MDSRAINYETLLENVVGMIGLLEYDSMRSAGKCKLNSNNLVSLYNLKDRYEAKLVPVTKPTTQKVAAKKAVAK
tara:strand:+ start:563 stop:784 length:222 start_codon:yes stop_codon:yes gene_type:complete